MKNQQIDIDSLHWYQLENPTSIQIAKMLFENSQSTFETFLSKKKTISCRQLRCMACGWNFFVFDKFSRYFRHQFFRTKSYYPKSWKLAPTLFHWRSDEKNYSVDFLIQVLTNESKRFKYFRESTPKKNPKKNFFFITDISKTLISDIRKLTKIVHIWNLVTLKSFAIATNIEIILLVKTSVTNFIIMEDCPRTLTKTFIFHRI